MEPEAQIAPPPEDLPLLGDNRNALRTSMVHILLNLSDNSKIYIIISLIFTLLKIIAMALILILTPTDTEKPLSTFIYILLACDISSLFGTFYFLFTEINSRSLQMKRIVSNLNNLISL